MLNLFKRPLHFYRPIKITQVSLGEIWDWNSLQWRLGIYLGIYWWFYCIWHSQTCAESLQLIQFCQLSTQLSRQLRVDLVAICLIHSLKSQDFAPFLDFQLILKRTLGHIKKNYTKNQVSTNCTIYVKIRHLLFSWGLKLIFAKCGWLRMHIFHSYHILGK